MLLLPRKKDAQGEEGDEGGCAVRERRLVVLVVWVVLVEEEGPEAAEEAEAVSEDRQRTCRWCFVVFFGGRRG